MKNKMFLTKKRLVTTASFLLSSTIYAAPTPPQNPFVSANGGSTMHGDASSSDVSPYAGPGVSVSKSMRMAKQAACPTVLFGSDNMPIALCTQIFGLSPIIHLLDSESKRSLASLKMTKGALLGGVYAYMDNQSRLVMVDGNNDLVRVAHEKVNGEWHLRIAEKVALSEMIIGHCGGKAGCDAVVGLVPDWQGKVFVATRQGMVGVVNPSTGKVSKLKLPKGERVDNSISSAPVGVSVVTSHATYLLSTGKQGQPVIRWRQPYDRGTARKPGQLSWGSGATPTFFGPKTGADYLTITDNADKQTNLLIYNAATGKQLCKVPLFKTGKSGTENSAIGYNRSVYVANTFGYPYPRLPEGAGNSIPHFAAVAGGMTRVDIKPDESGCQTVWENKVKSSAVPRLSSKDGYIYTVERTGLVSPGYYFHLRVIDANYGNVVASHYLGYGFIYDTLEMVGTIMPNGTWYQGVLTGVLKAQ